MEFGLPCSLQTTLGPLLRSFNVVMAHVTCRNPYDDVVGVQLDRSSRLAFVDSRWKRHRSVRGSGWILSSSSRDSLVIPLIGESSRRRGRGLFVIGRHHFCRWPCRRLDRLLCRPLRCCCSSSIAAAGIGAGDGTCAPLTRLRSHLASSADLPDCVADSHFRHVFFAKGDGESSLLRHRGENSVGRRHYLSSSSVMARVSRN